MNHQNECIDEEGNPDFLHERVHVRKRILKNISIVFVLTIIFMSAYEMLKQFLIPGISIWTSHIVTIIVTAVLAVFIALIPLLRTERLLCQLGKNQAEIREMKKAILTSNKKLNMLSSLTRHDILNLLTVITAYTEMIADSDIIQKNPEQNEYIKKIQKSVDSLNNIISSTRDYQDIGVKAPVWIDVRGTFLKISREYSQFQHFTIVPPEEDIEIYADSMFERVIYNLMDNTLKHAEDATTISLRFLIIGNNGCLMYEDDGQGIPEDEKEKIFNHSYGKNSGLGLFLVREILEITDITISEEGIPGKGACFKITIHPDKWRSIEAD